MARGFAGKRRDLLEILVVAAVLVLLILLVLVVLLVLLVVLVILLVPVVLLILVRHFLFLLLVSLLRKRSFLGAFSFLVRSVPQKYCARSAAKYTKYNLWQLSQKKHQIFT